MKTLFLFIGLFLSAASLVAQIEAVTIDGKAVKLNDDGTWIYFRSFKLSNYSESDCSELTSIVGGNDNLLGKMVSDMGLMFVRDTIHDKFLYITLQKDFKDPFSIAVHGDSICIPESSFMTVTFRDGTEIVMGNNYGDNCKGEFKSDFKDDLSIQYHLKLLLSKEIRQIKIFTLFYDLDVTFTPRMSKNFLNVINCVVENL